MQSFPKPVRIGGHCTRWLQSDLERYDAACGGKQSPQVDPDRECYLSARRVAARYGTSISTIWRWASLTANSDGVAT